VEGFVLPEASVGSSQALVRVDGILHTSEGPTLQWADRQNPGVMLFTLNDAAKGKIGRKSRLGSSSRHMP
jgi:hypothetical protein